MKSAQEASPGITLWRRIADELEQDIVGGDYASGERLPGEIDMARRFGVNRHTVRRALAELSERGLVRAARGSGTFVDTGRLSYPIGARTRFSEIIGKAGLAPAGRLIGHRRESASPEIAARLGIAAQAPVICLEILRSADRVPIALATTHVPEALMPDAARVFARLRSMTKMLAHFGVADYRRWKTNITAALADSVQADRLGIAPGRPLLLVEKIDVGRDGRPLATSITRFSADRVELVVES
jgi:GntR family transcriptional regulator, phosphonate transport system regulatory protein